MFIVFWDTGSHIYSRTRIKTRTRLLYSDTNLNGIRIAAVGSDRYFILEIKHTRFITWLSQLMAAGEERENPGNYIYSPHG